MIISLPALGKVIESLCMIHAVGLAVGTLVGFIVGAVGDAVVGDVVGLCVGLRNQNQADKRYIAKILKWKYMKRAHNTSRVNHEVISPMVTPSMAARPPNP